MVDFCLGDLLPFSAMRSGAGWRAEDHSIRAGPNYHDIIIKRGSFVNTVRLRTRFKSK